MEKTRLYDTCLLYTSKLIENTNMTKVYKMPVLQAIYNDSDIRMEVTNEEIVDCWKAFFDVNENWRDFD